MNGLIPSLWAEMLKMRRSKVPLLTAVGFSFVPLVGGLFMIILKDPQAARSMGLISAKAQLTAGTAEWSTLFGLLAQATAVGGSIVFAIFTMWVFGREFADRTVKELLALPTSRETIVTAKFIVVVAWTIFLTLLAFALGLLVGRLVVIPGWSQELLQTASVDIIGAGLLSILLLPFVALVASLARGYMASFGWLILTVFLGQIAVLTGWGDWFPWSVPALFSGAAGPRAGLMGTHSYVIVSLASLIGIAATFYWWRSADHTR
jgi:ABC-2 type transport system permease protein